MEVQLPPVVYIPAEAPPGTSDPKAEYRLTKDNRKVLLVYTALDRLVDCMGEHQPWVACSPQSLQELWQADQFDLTLIDVEVPAEHRIQGAW